jgi:hypothetical protein
MVLDADKFLKVAVGLGVLTAGLGVGYHYGIYLPQSERLKIERSEEVARERQQAASNSERERKDRYNSCLAQAEKDHYEAWAADCKGNGIGNKGPNCALPKYNADSWDRIRKEDKERCLSEFKLGI